MDTWASALGIIIITIKVLYEFHTSAIALTTWSSLYSSHANSRVAVNVITLWGEPRTERQVALAASLSEIVLFSSSMMP